MGSHQLVVQLHAEARTGRQRCVAVDDLGLRRLHQLGAQARLAEPRRAEFHHRDGEGCGLQVEVRDVGDAGGEAVGDELRAVQFAQLGDAHQLGEPAGPADAGLHQRHAAGRQPFPHFPAARREFGAADPDGRHGGQAGVAGQVVVPQRGLREGHVEVLDAAQRPDGVVPVPPAVAEVERHSELVAERCPAVSDERHDGPVGHLGTEQHRHFDGGEALVRGDCGLAGDLVEHRVHGSVVDVARIAGRIGPDSIRAGAAEQLVDGQCELASGEVVERDVDG